MTYTGTFCGVFRRQALDRGAMLLKVDKIVTGLSKFRYCTWRAHISVHNDFLQTFVQTFWARKEFIYRVIMVYFRS